MASMAQDSGFRITGRMVLLGLIAFFGVVGAVNGAFMYFALDTFPGLTDDEAYKHGVAYNQTLADGQRQAALGWKTHLVADGATLKLTLTGKDGGPLNGAVVTADVQRPIGPRDDTQVTFQADGDGVYRAPFDAPVAGRWKVDLAIVVGQDHFRARHEVMVKK